MSKEDNRLHSVIKLMRSALEWYENRDHYDIIPGRLGEATPCAVMRDQGERARLAIQRALDMQRRVA